MKTVTTLFVLFASVVCFSQNVDSVFVGKYDDSTFVESKLVFDSDGRKLSENNVYFHTDLFSKSLYTEYERDLRILDDLAAQEIIVKKRSNQTKKFLRDSMAINCDSMAVLSFKSRYLGDRTLIVRGVNVENIQVRVSEISNKRRLRIREKVTPVNRTGTVKIIHRDKIELIGFFDEKVQLVKVGRNKYKGKQGGIVYVLKK
jgi:hypothetical protein